MEQLMKPDELAAKWRVSEYQLAVWSREGCVKGAEKMGRLWRYRPDARYEPRAKEDPKNDDLTWDDVLGKSKKRPRKPRPKN